MDLRAVIFIPALVAAAICVFFFLTFASHYYLTVLESTAAGSKEVQWIPETVIDNFWKPFYLGWLLCLWLGPAYVIGRTLAGSTGLMWLKIAVPVFVAWALYPVSQLSSLSASSVWIPLHAQVFARLAQKPAVTLGFFLLTLPVFALAGAAFKWAFLTKDEWELLFAGVPLMVLAGFLYARLLGRLAFALMFTRDLLKRRKKKKPKKEARDVLESAAAEREEKAEPTFTQPGEVTISTPDGEVAGYNVLIADDPPPKKRVKAEVVEDDGHPAATPEPSPAKPHAKRSKREVEPARAWTDEDDDATPYDAHPAEVQPEESAPGAVIKPDAEELALLERTDAPKPPKKVWGVGLFAFLAQPGTVSAIIILTGIGLLAGAAVRVARMFDPTT
jgi:hypothetical protein